MPPVRVGLVGCGRIAHLVHLRVLARLPDVELVALAEPDPQRRAAASRQAPRARALMSYEEVLRMPDVEAVVICLPNAMHAQSAQKALQLGKHVYLEKPIATSLSEAESVLAAWRRAGVIGMIGFNYRFNPLYQTARDYIRSGRVGKVVCARSVFSTVERAAPAWRQTRHSGGGVLLDLASHHVDLLSFLLEEPVRDVFATPPQEAEDGTAMLQMQLASGVPVQSFFSMKSIEEDRVEIFGRSGKLTVDRYLSLDVDLTAPTRKFARLKRLWRSFRSLHRSPYLLHKVFSPGHEPSYRSALAAFVAAVRSGRPAAPDFDDGYNSLAVIEAAELSIRTGRVVSVPALVDQQVGV